MALDGAPCIEKFVLPPKEDKNPRPLGSRINLMLGSSPFVLTILYPSLSHQVAEPRRSASYVKASGTASFIWKNWILAGDSYYYPRTGGRRHESHHPHQSFTPPHFSRPLSHLRRQTPCGSLSLSPCAVRGEGGVRGWLVCGVGCLLISSLWRMRRIEGGGEEMVDRPVFLRRGIDATMTAMA